MRKLPLETQTFEKSRNSNCLSVDKSNKMKESRTYAYPKLLFQTEKIATRQRFRLFQTEKVVDRQGFRLFQTEKVVDRQGFRLFQTEKVTNQMGLRFFQTETIEPETNEIKSKKRIK
jgi:hypothetical protein